jgi:hypothetical protein
MTESCPICESKLNNKNQAPNGRDATVFSCILCGDFLLSRTLVSNLASYFRDDERASTKISHAIRMMQRVNDCPEFTTNTIEDIIKKSLPKPKEQADLFIRWLAENSDTPGQLVYVSPDTHRTIMGATSPDGFKLIVSHLLDVGLVKGDFTAALATPHDATVTLSFDGWEYYDQLQLGKGTYKKAFMAMKFGVEELNTILDETFKPAVQQTGFELQLLSDTPRAGLIDDRLRSQIQAADFIIADLTHDNLGAYWEAGYAEGLGKPVIYTCEKGKFDKDKTHFDTNHHLTIIWDSGNPRQSGEDLKATIRATLPHLAIQIDPYKA